MVEAALKDISSAKQICRTEDAVTFHYKDKDDDNVTSIVTIQDDERLFAVLMLPVPEGHFVTSMICSNMYNIRKDAHGTFAYATKLGDEHYVALEANLMSRGGITEAALRQTMRNFIAHIDTFESVLISAIRELGPDSSFLKSSGWGSFWEAAGHFLEGVAEASRT